MKRLLLSLLSATALLASDIYYDIVVPYNFSNTFFDVTQDNGETISAIGFTPLKKVQNSARSYDDPFSFLAAGGSNYGEQMHLVQFSNSGEIVFDKRFNLNRYNRATSLVKTANNDYYIGGYTLDGSLILSRMHANGMQEYLKFFGTDNFDTLHKLLALRDGGVLAIGTSATSRDVDDNIFEGGLGLNDIYLTRFNKAGKKVWSKKYGTQSDEKCVDVAEANDGSLIILAQKLHKEKKQILLLRISENGDKIWLNTYNNSGKYRPYTLTPLKDGNFLASLSYSDKRGEHLKFILFDKEGNKLKEKILKLKHTHIKLHEIKEHLNGSLTAVGEINNRGTQCGIILHVDHNFDLLWEKIPYAKKHSPLYAMDILRDGDIVAVGTRTKSQSEVSNMWIIKLHSNGEYALKFNHTLDFYNRLRHTFNQEIQNGSVTITPHLTFTCNTIKFQAGKYRLTPKKEQMFLHVGQKLLTFLHNHQEQIDSIIIDGYTSSEWRGANYDKRYLNNLDLSAKRALYIHKLLYNQSPKSIKKMLQSSAKSGANSYAKQLKIGSTNQDAREVEIKIKLK